MISRRNRRSGPCCARTRRGPGREGPAGGRAPGSWVTLAPRRRGDHALRTVHARWTRPARPPRAPDSPRRIDQRVGVVPNLGAVARGSRCACSPITASWPASRSRSFIGDGSEFEALREYVPGLDHRAIDWKSSARHRKLLCQEFRAERNHQVVLAVDAGQLMSEPVGGVPKLDHAINAAILLGWFCLRTGDRVGLLGFDERVRQWPSPRAACNVRAPAGDVGGDRPNRRVETNYTLTLAELSTRFAPPVIGGPVHRLSSTRSPPS